MVVGVNHFIISKKSKILMAACCMRTNVREMTLNIDKLYASIYVYFSA